jgi:5-methylcytosine-specific restriction endonuclease McrA
MFGWLRKAPQDAFGAPRSGQWPRVRREHLAVQPVCQACGRAKELEVHHVRPYHEHPELELDPCNLITLCGDPCHIVHGHLMSWTRTNATVVEDCKAYRAKLENA